MWTLRNFLELQDHPYASFITLTYAPEFLPDRALLHHPDVQKFLKRLRKSTGSRIRYFGCGEYGSKTQRPHYHLIVYGLRPTYRGSPEHQRLIDIWGLGHVDVGDVTVQSIQYVCGYTLKSGQPRNWCYVVPPYSMMSRQQGIGKKRFLEMLDKFESMDEEILAAAGYTISNLKIAGRAFPIGRYLKSLISDREILTNGHHDPTDYTNVFLPADIADQLRQEENYNRTKENQLKHRKGDF